MTTQLWMRPLYRTMFMGINFSQSDNVVARLHQRSCVIHRDSLTSSQHRPVRGRKPAWVGWHWRFFWFLILPNPRFHGDKHQGFGQYITRGKLFDQSIHCHVGGRGATGHASLCGAYIYIQGQDIWHIRLRWHPRWSLRLFQISFFLSFLVDEYPT